jgi:hypothetical protein
MHQIGWACGMHGSEEMRRGFWRKLAENVILEAWYEDNIKVDLEEMVQGLDWICLAQDVVAGCCGHESKFLELDMREGFFLTTWAPAASSTSVCSGVN